jgi:hypothetical protein
MDKKAIIIKAGEALYGERWQTSLARDLGLSDGRRIRQWLSGDRPIPDGVVSSDLPNLLKSRKIKIDNTLSEIEKN